MSFTMNWQNQESMLLLNPRLDSTENAELTSLYKKFDQYPGHVWIASSGSAQKMGESKKLFALGKNAILASAEAANTHLQVAKHDRWLNVLPRFHVGGLGILARAFLSETPVSDLSDKAWSPMEFTQTCREQKITLSSLVPTQVYDLVSMELKAPESVRAIVVGGAVLSAELYRRARLLGWRLLPSFGMTEFCSQIATAELETLAQTEYPKALKILSHIKASINTEGFLLVDGPSKYSGFAQLISGEAKWTAAPPGPVLTADRAEIFNQHLIPHGRGEEYIKIKGEGVSLQWLRERFQEVHASENNVLIAIQDARDGAKIVLAGEEATASLQTYASRFNQSAAPYERISGVAHIEKLPRTELGKIKFEELKRDLSERLVRGDVLPL